jgi:RNA-binding protein 39
MPTPQGFVYLKFGSTEAAQAAAQVMNGRFYCGNVIRAEFQFAQVYDAHFGLA